jgi:hypothetical protein
MQCDGGFGWWKRCREALKAMAGGEVALQVSVEGFLTLVTLSLPVLSIVSPSEDNSNSKNEPQYQ